MIRAILALVLIAAAVAVAVFAADNPGHVAIVWRGWQVDTSVGVLVGLVALLVIAASLLVLLLAALSRLPRDLRRRRAARRRRAGEAVLTRGLVALAAGDAVEAGRHARRAVGLLEGAPVPLLLAAEAATRQGDTVAARLSYTALLEQPETEFLGLRGLISQALRGGDDAVALRLAERAQALLTNRKQRAGAGWLADTLLLLQARGSDWRAAQATLADATRRRALPAARARHHQGVVLFELSRDAEHRGELGLAVKLAARAQNLAVDLAAAALHHARLLLALGRRRAARRAIERAWRTAPHPELARLYLDIDPAAGPLARAAAAQRLAAQNPAAAESHFAVAEAALAAQLWGEARRHLDLALAAGPAPEPSRRLCRLMARLEESEAGDVKTARAWLDRAIGAPADLSHVCSHCGATSPEWLPLCRECGAFDTLAWGAPPVGSASSIGRSGEIAPMLPSPAVPDQPERLGDGRAMR